MTSSLSNFIAVAAALVAVLALAACGSGGKGSDAETRSGAGVGANLSGETIAQVGQYKVTKAMLNEWMAELVGEEYYRAMSQPAPPHLAIDPPDYQACVASLRTVAPDIARESELTSKCESLYLAMRKQALDYLVSTFWGMNYARTRGLTVSEAEAKRGLEIFRRREFPHPADYERLLASRRRTSSQELFLIKVDLLQQKVLQRLHTSGHEASAAFIAGIGRAVYGVHCRAGYVVEHCLGYNKRLAASTVIPPSAVVFAEIARWRPN